MARLTAITAVVLFASAISFVSTSASEEISDDSEEFFSDSSFVNIGGNVPPSPKNVKLYTAHRLESTPSPVDLVRSNSGDQPHNYDQTRRTVTDESLFYPLGLDNFYSNVNVRVDDDQNPGIVDLESWMKPGASRNFVKIIKNINLKDQGIVMKSLSTFFLTALFLLFYNGVVLHLI